jgi:hypothetical protein
LLSYCSKQLTFIDVFALSLSANGKKGTPPACLISEADPSTSLEKVPVLHLDWSHWLSLGTSKARNRRGGACRHHVAHCNRGFPSPVKPGMERLQRFCLVTAYRRQLKLVAHDEEPYLEPLYYTWKILIGYSLLLIMIEHLTRNHSLS